MKKIPLPSASLDSTIGKARASYVYFLTDPEVGRFDPLWGRVFFFIFLFFYLLLLSLCRKFLFSTIVGNNRIHLVLYICLTVSLSIHK